MNIEISTMHVIAGTVALKVQRQDDGSLKRTMEIRTAGEKAVAELTEEEARYFFEQGRQVLGVVGGDDWWTRLPTYAAVEADRQRNANRKGAQ
jgi:hypothetical protein